MEAGGIIDLPLGPNQVIANACYFKTVALILVVENQASGVPAELGTDGLQWDLQPFSINVPVGGNFSGTLPGWGTGKLVSASTGLVISVNSVTGVGTLASSSLTDITADGGTDGSVSISFSGTTTGVRNVVFAYYLTHTNYYEQNSPVLVAHGVPQSTPTSYIQNGSLVWDHFSTQGAQLAINFWDEHLLTGNSKKLLQQVGNYLWEDSQVLHLISRFHLGMH